MNRWSRPSHLGLAARDLAALWVLTVAEAKMVKTRMWELASGTWALLNGPGHKRQGG